jgi:DNA-binding transcriptional MerR regulator
MSDTHIYTIGELAELAGVTPRTIRYYTSEGLLPRPDARGQYALYNEEHLLRLRLIGRLKDAYLPLSEIKAQIEHLSAEQVGALLADNTQPQPQPPSSAADYLAQVLTRPVGLSALAESGEQYRLSLASPVPAPAPAAPAMQLPEPPVAPAAPAPAPPGFGFVAPAEQPAQRARLLHRLLPSRREHATPASEVAPAEEQWRRIQLAPGIELHLREPLAAALSERAEQLIALARRLFEDQAG